MNKFYSTYTLEDFLTDDAFIDWVKAPDADQDALWRNWLKEYPEQEAVVKEAISFIRGMQFEEHVISEKRIQHLKANIQEQISLNESEKEEIAFVNQANESATHNWWGNNWYKVAAVLGGLILLAGITYRLVSSQNELITRHTAFGQTIKIELPDHSIVNLNGNSTLKYASGWDPENTREVWLDGEAYFSVVHTAKNQKFVVRTSDKVNVEVLGTEFNVSNRKSRTQVVLSSGKVRLNIKEAAQTGQVTMKPGELVELADHSDQYLKKKVNPRVYTSWKDKILLFDNTPLKEVARNLEETYGLQVQLSDASLSEMKVSGSAPIDNLDVIFAGLSRTFDLTIIRDKNLVVFRKKF